LIEEKKLLYIVIGVIKSFPEHLPILDINIISVVIPAILNGRKYMLLVGKIILIGLIKNITDILLGGNLLEEKQLKGLIINVNDVGMQRIELKHIILNHKELANQQMKPTNYLILSSYVSPAII
jgi:hypothetical protein